MSTTISLPDPPPLPVEHESRRAIWTRASVRRAASLGFFDPERYELLAGELLEKVKNRRHTITLRRVRQALLALFPEEFLQAEAPINVAPEDNETSAPEPDLVVLTRPDESFLDTDPSPFDIALLIEVADSTLRRDLGIKAARYARARIPEYWVVDIENRKLHVHREPVGDTWANIAVLTETQRIAPLAKPAGVIALDKLFGR